MFNIVCRDTQITVISDSIMKSTRFIKNRIYMVVTKLDGSVGDLGTKVTRMTKLDDEMFMEFDRIQREAGDV